MESSESIFKTVTIRILRYKPNRIDPPRYQDFRVEVDPNMSVLDALEKIRLEQDRTLMYRHSCHHSSCGTCACQISGKERLTCVTRISDLKEDPIDLSPLAGFNTVGDLVVDVNRFFADYSAHWSYIRSSNNSDATCRPEGINRFTRFENCIECGACVSACPVSPDRSAFLGPAVLSGLNRELKKSPQKTEELLAAAGGKRGERLCQRALNCSRVCPTKVYPARHIADLRKLKKAKS